MVLSEEQAGIPRADTQGQEPVPVGPDLLNTLFSGDGQRTKTSLAGLVLTDNGNNPIYANAEAVRILIYPKPPGASGMQHNIIRERLRAVLSDSSPSQTPVLSYCISGRRRYSCRILTIEQLEATAARSYRLVLLERPQRKPIDLSRIVERYRLSQRERESIELLVCGFTSKQIADRLNLSPNTVKSFMRSIMLKMGVTTRSAVVGKLFESRRELSQQKLHSHNALDG